MGCGASADTFADSHTPNESPLHAALQGSPLHTNHHGDATRPIDAEESAAHAALDRDWCMRSDGDVASEPGALASAVRRGVSAAAARLLHGVDSDPDQFAAEAAEEDAATREVAAHRRDAILAWASSCHRPAPLLQAPYNDDSTKSLALSAAPLGFRDDETPVDTPTLGAKHDRLDVGLITPATPCTLSPGSLGVSDSSAYLPQAAMSMVSVMPVALTRFDLLRHDNSTSRRLSNAVRHAASSRL